MDAKKQASIADALAKGVMVKIPELESHVPDFFRGMIPAVTPAQEAEIGVYLGKVAAKASDGWDEAHASQVEAGGVAGPVGSKVPS